MEPWISKIANFFVFYWQLSSYLPVTKSGLQLENQMAYHVQSM